MTVPRLPAGQVATFRGSVPVGSLGPTLIHEHLFVRNPELEINQPDPEWDPAAAVESAVTTLGTLNDLGIRTVVDLTVPGLGRDARLVAEVARRTPINLIASTGWYTPDALPLYYRLHGPGRAIDEGVDPLARLFVRDITEGIAATGVRAAMIKAMTDAPGRTPDVERVLTAAAEAHVETGAPITVHTLPRLRDGVTTIRFLEAWGVDPRHVIVGHAGDSEDLAYLRALVETGASIGIDRFGMEHVLPDEQRIRVVLAMLDGGYRDRMVLSHDAAIYSHATPPSWRSRHAPDWRFEHLSTVIVPTLRRSGVTDDDLDQLFVRNPARLLAGASR